MRRHEVTDEAMSKKQGNEDRRRITHLFQQVAYFVITVGYVNVLDHRLVLRCANIVVSSERSVENFEATVRPWCVRVSPDGLQLTVVLPAAVNHTRRRQSCYASHQLND